MPVTGKPVTGTDAAVIRHSHNGRRAGEHHLPADAAAEAAVAAARAAREETARTPSSTSVGGGG